MIDVAEPAEDFSVARFQAEARAAIADVESRGRRALLVGGHRPVPARRWSTISASRGRIRELRDADRRPVRG